MKKIKTILNHLYRGTFCELPNYGYHPGTPIISIMLFAFAAAGGFSGFVFGCITFLPVYLWGSYCRSIEDPEQPDTQNHE